MLFDIGKFLISLYLRQQFGGIVVRRRRRARAGASLDLTIPVRFFCSAPSSHAAGRTSCMGVGQTQQAKKFPAGNAKPRDKTIAAPGAVSHRAELHLLKTELTRRLITIDIPTKHNVVLIL